jgi:hypothetical protein
MNPRVSNQKTAALTLVEVLVVIVVLFVLAVVILPAINSHHEREHISCVRNLKQISLAFLIWEGDNGGKYPMQVSVTNGGMMELTADGKNAWLNLVMMSNELSTPIILVCPQDKEHLPPAAKFSSQLAGHVSYFVNVDANDANPQMFLSGDDNFAIGGVPVKPGLLELSTNAPITWTSGRHEDSEMAHLWIPTKYGNIGLADGSVASVTGSGLANLLSQTGVTTNRLAIP